MASCSLAGHVIKGSRMFDYWIDIEETANIRINNAEDLLCIVNIYNDKNTDMDIHENFYCDVPKSEYTIIKIKDTIHLDRADNYAAEISKALEKYNSADELISSFTIMDAEESDSCGEALDTESDESDESTESAEYNDHERYLCLHTGKSLDLETVEKWCRPVSEDGHDTKKLIDAALDCGALTREFVVEKLLARAKSDTLYMYNLSRLKDRHRIEFAYKEPTIEILKKGIECGFLNYDGEDIFKLLEDDPKMVLKRLVADFY
jgi:hypothetical protein